MTTPTNSSQQKERILLIATGNEGKFAEISHEFAEFPVKCISLKECPQVEECEETESSFEGNAKLKARYYAEKFHFLTLADDSGLEVDALNGAPGVFSARFAGEPCDDKANNEKLVRELTGVSQQQRTARFRCAMALADENGKILVTTEGTIEGEIIDNPIGENGFGYDPHFLVPELGKTTAEIPREEKNKISHRGKATRKMKEKIEEVIGR